MSVSPLICASIDSSAYIPAEISGFYFMEADTDFKPEQELVDFLKGGDAPIYIG